MWLDEYRTRTLLLFKHRDECVVCILCILKLRFLFEQCLSFGVFHGDLS